MRFQEENQRINKEYNNKNMKKKHPILIVHTKWNCQKMKKNVIFLGRNFKKPPPKSSQL